MSSLIKFKKVKSVEKKNKTELCKHGLVTSFQHLW